MKWITVTFLSICFHWVSAQNCVPNPDFENTNGSFCGIFSGSDYTATAMNWYSPSQGSPDLYFTTIDPSCFNFQPNSTYSGPIGLKGPQLPRSGNVMSGIYLYSISGFEQREYIQVPLSSPLAIGGKYVVECYISLADYTEFGTDRMGMYLSTQAVSLTTNNVMNYTPHVIADSVIMDTQGWVRIADTITATVSYAYLTIGNFSSDAQTPTTANPTCSWEVGTYGSYYYVDDVRVERVLTSGLDELDATKRKLVKIYDLIGRETEFIPNTILIYLYDDGSIERVMKSEK